MPSRIDCQLHIALFIAQCDNVSLVTICNRGLLQNAATVNCDKYHTDHAECETAVQNMSVPHSLRLKRVFSSQCYLITECDPALKLRPVYIIDNTSTSHGLSELKPTSISTIETTVSVHPNLFIYRGESC